MYKEKYLKYKNKYMALQSKTNYLKLQSRIDRKNLKGGRIPIAEPSLLEPDETRILTIKNLLPSLDSNYYFSNTDF